MAPPRRRHSLGAFLLRIVLVLTVPIVAGLISFAYLFPGVGGDRFLTEIEEEIEGYGRVVRQAPWLHRDLSHGRWTSYHPDGGVRETGRQHHARGRVGEWRSFHPNGQLAASGRYAGGVRTGRWEIWSESGELVERRSYIYGVEHQYEILTSRVHPVGRYVTPGHEPVDPVD